MRSWSLLVLVAMLLSCQAAAPAQPTLDDLWHDKAHFEARGEIGFAGGKGGPAGETATWYSVQEGRWYAFSREGVFPSVASCPHEHMRIVVRESRDKGKSWSPPSVAVEPNTSIAGDACAVLDGSSYYDASNNSWHLLAQCLDLHDKGGWGLCHYSRKATSPVGRFVPDAANPVVRGGAIWSRICGPSKACPLGVIDEGTPDIVQKRGGLFVVTIHGFDQRTGKGYRTAVETPDFRSWRTASDILPDDATLSVKDCQSWFKGCVGFGEGASLVARGRIYTVVETMDKSLLCQEDQQWVFVLLRSTGQQWPRSGSGQWERLGSRPLIQRAWPDPHTPCAVAYARWIVDDGDVYLTYEDWEPRHARLHRRLFRLVAGPGEPLALQR